MALFRALDMSERLISDQEAYIAQKYIKKKTVARYRPVITVDDIVL